jgi:hypothetical protein
MPHEVPRYPLHFFLFFANNFSMAQSIELYYILRGYALKIDSPVIEIRSFLEFLEKYASFRIQEQADWAKWTSDTEKKFWAELPPLVESNKCLLLSDTAQDRLFIPSFCLEKLRNIYLNSDKVADRPFPDEDILKVSIPNDQVLVINLSSDVELFFKEIAKGSPALPNAGGEGAETADAAPDIKKKDQSRAGVETEEYMIKLVFSEGYGSALVPSGLFPRRLLEAAFLKLRGYLLNRGNKDYILHKLSPYMPAREKYMRELMDQLIAQPTECFRNLESSGDSSSMFWTCFSSLIKTDIKNKSELLSEDLGAIQAAFLVDACNVFYKERDTKRKEREQALRNLDQHLERPPFYYTLDDIVKFTNDREILLLDIFSRQELEEHIKKRTTESEKNELPEWLILQGKKGERWYIKKNKYLPLCTKMLIGIRPNIKKEIVNRWIHLMKEFRKEPAMEKDEEFDRLLSAYTVNENPALVALLEDPKLYLVYSELQRAQVNIPAASRIFRDGRLLPMSVLYAFRRRDMVTDVKFLLPFWYSIPILANIIAFFKNRKNKKPQKKQNRERAANTAIASQGTEARTIQNSAREIVDAMVPQGLMLDEYLTDLEGRWSRILDKKARQNLVSDVRALLKDNLRYAVKIHKTKQLSQKSLGELADGLIDSSTTLQRLSSGQALRQYMQLYMAKLLISYR